MRIRLAACSRGLLIASLLVSLHTGSPSGRCQTVTTRAKHGPPLTRDTNTAPVDVYAAIGNRTFGSDRGPLEEVRPPTLPRTILPNGDSDPSAAFTPRNTIDTPEELDAELARQRRSYAPFLEDLAPALPSLRETLRLEDFQWRMETGADRTDFQHTVSGAGDWKAIKVPHFGGPIGRAVAYYRTTFPVTRAMLDKGALFVRFGAVDYKAHVFVNGHYLGSHEGFFAPFEVECICMRARR